MMEAGEGKKKSRGWLWLLLLLLLLWWWWSRRKRASTAQGGYQAPYGYAPGDVSDSSLERLADETIRALNSRLYRKRGSAYMPEGLFDAYKWLKANGFDTAEVKAEIQEALLEYRYSRSTF